MSPEKYCPKKIFSSNFLPIYILQDNQKLPRHIHRHTNTDPFSHTNTHTHTHTHTHMHTHAHTTTTHTDTITHTQTHTHTQTKTHLLCCQLLFWCYVFVYSEKFLLLAIAPFLFSLCLPSSLSLHT